MRKKFLDSFLNKKILIGCSLKSTDPTQKVNLAGRRYDDYTLLKNFPLKTALTRFLNVFKFLVQSDKRIGFIYRSQASVAFLRLAPLLKFKPNFILYTPQNFKNKIRKEKAPAIIVSFFLESKELKMVFTETFQKQVPLVCFIDQKVNFFSNSLQIVGNFSQAQVRTFVVSLIILCIKKYGSS